MGEASSLRRKLNLYPPLLGAGIKVTKISDDFRHVEVSLKLHFWNRTIVGTAFGGSLYAMCDPFFMLILMKNLGRDYIVWDKAATIRFRRPGRGVLRAVFAIDEKTIESIRSQAEISPKVEPTFRTVITDVQGEVIAEVEKLLYVRKKQTETSPQTQSGRAATP